MILYNEITENYKIITENVNKAKSDFGINEEIRIMAVTKGIPYEKVNHAISLGIDLLGENRAQEFLQKEPFYAKTTKNNEKPEIHFIGGLQKNKVKYIIDKVSLIQSVDSEELLAKINRQLAIFNLNIEALIEVNIGSEWSKGGVSPDRLFELLSFAEDIERVRIRGLMAIPPIEAKEQVYADMRELFETAKSQAAKPQVKYFDILSVGMSQDYITAIKHGANLIRIGSALFGGR